MKLDFAELLHLPELPDYIESVEKEMRAVLMSTNPHIHNSIEKLLQVRGKRLRPSLVFAMAACAGKPIDTQLIAAGVSVELVHLGSLVHDDIIDKAATRWNRPTVHREEGIGQAIILGDYLLAKACSLAAAIDTPSAKTVADTIARMCEGQGLELTDQFNKNRTADAYFYTIRGKTAALIAAACELGGYRAGMTNKQLTAARQYGEAFGTTYQLIDDVLDLISSPELYGKPTNADMRQGVYTLPLLLARESTPEILTHLKDDQGAITDQLVRNGHVQKAIAEAESFANRARSELRYMKNNATTQGLQALPLAFVQASIQNLVAESYKPMLYKHI